MNSFDESCDHIQDIDLDDTLGLTCFGKDTNYTGST